MKKRLSHISGQDFERFMSFASQHPRIVKPDHILQKLVIFNFVSPLIARYKPERILEIGCGLGFHSALLTNHGRVSATELQTPGSFALNDVPATNGRTIVLGELAKSDVEFQFNDGKVLPYPDNSFDLIFHNSVIEHVPDPVAFNRETWRVLKPGGIAICITGTPALCWLRLIRDHYFRLPLTMVASFVKESGMTRRLKISDRIKALIPESASRPGKPPAIPPWYSRLAHYVYSPHYNALVLDELAQEAGICSGAALVAAHEHFRDSLFNRIRYYFTPRTHGQHYRNYRHEMSEWKMDRWRSAFTLAGFQVEEVVSYRFHHLLELTWSSKINAMFYHLAAPLIERVQRCIPPEFASEFILVARRR